VDAAIPQLHSQIMTFLDPTRQFSQICDLDTQGTVHVDPEAGHAEAVGFGRHFSECSNYFVDMGEFWERHKVIVGNPESRIQENLRSNILFYNWNTKTA
jgi:hypothetical protein